MISEKERKEIDDEIERTGTVETFWQDSGKGIDTNDFDGIVNGKKRHFVYVDKRRNDGKVKGWYLKYKLV
jgi:hypothetical protein